MEQQVLDRLVGLVRVIVPPAAIVHERLTGGMVLGAGDSDGMVRGKLVRTRS